MKRLKTTCIVSIMVLIALLTGCSSTSVDSDVQDSQDYDVKLMQKIICGDVRLEVPGGYSNTLGGSAFADIADGYWVYIASDEGEPQIAIRNIRKFSSGTDTNGKDERDEQWENDKKDKYAYELLSENSRKTEDGTVLYWYSAAASYEGNDEEILEHFPSKNGVMYEEVLCIYNDDTHFHVVVMDESKNKSDILFSKVMESVQLVDGKAIQEKKDAFTKNYEKADFDKYNSYASDNGLGGTFIWVEGVIEEIFALDSGDESLGESNYAILTSAYGEKWIVYLDPTVIKETSMFDQILNKQLVVCGSYAGFSDKYQCPYFEGIKIYNEVDNNEITCTMGYMAYGDPSES